MIEVTMSAEEAYAIINQLTDAGLLPELVENIEYRLGLR